MIDRCLGAEPGDQLAIGVGVRGSDHPGTSGCGQPHDLVADPAGRANDEHGVAGLEGCLVDDAVRRGPARPSAAASVKEIINPGPIVTGWMTDEIRASGARSTDHRTSRNTERHR